MTLTREQILQADDIKRETVEVPEWGGSVIVTTISGECRDELEQHIFDQAKPAKDRFKNLRARTLSLCLVDAAGARLFTEGDIEALGRKSASSLNLLFGVAQRLNGLSQADVDDITKK